MNANEEGPHSRQSGDHHPWRSPRDFPGYPPPEVRIGIRAWGTPEDRRTLRAWESFIQGRSDTRPGSLAKWKPAFMETEQQVRCERDLERRREANETRMRWQIARLRDALDKGFVRSPADYSRYPDRSMRRGLGMWGHSSHKAYIGAWNRFMRGERDTPPAPTSFHPKPRPVEEFIRHPELLDEAEGAFRIALERRLGKYAFGNRTSSEKGSQDDE